jgi:hypothetical protein
MPSKRRRKLTAGDSTDTDDTDMKIEMHPTDDMDEEKVTGRLKISQSDFNLE